MNRYRNKLVYDSETGEIRDDKKFMSMLKTSGYHGKKVAEEQRFKHCQSWELR